MASEQAEAAERVRQDKLPALQRNLPTTEIRVHTDTKGLLDALRGENESFDAFFWRWIIVPARTTLAPPSRTWTTARRRRGDGDALPGRDATAGVGAEE